MDGASYPLLSALAALLILVGCGSEAATGPVNVHWDRDTCERCAMAVGDRRFAAQVRVPDSRRVRLFDDIGCALIWIEENASEPSRAALEIWVSDTTGTKWIDARAARFAAGHETPMGYGYATVGADTAQSMGLEEMQRRLAAKEDERRRPHD